MSKKINLALTYFLVNLVGVKGCLVAAPSQRPPQDSLRDVHTAINALKYSTNNHELELQQAHERFQNIEDIVSLLRKDVSELHKQQTEQLQAKTCELKLNVHSLEADIQKLKHEMQQAQGLIKESLSQLAQHKNNLVSLMQRDDVREKNIEHLQAAMNSLMEALQGPEAAKKASTYRVKGGDTLEKIAIANKTSVKVLKELNGLLTDRIREGQELKLPEL